MPSFIAKGSANAPSLRQGSSWMEQLDSRWTCLAGIISPQTCPNPKPWSLAPSLMWPVGFLAVTKLRVLR